MPIDLSMINWLAVIVAALATFFLGAVWYMALFGKLWQRLQGISDEKKKQMQAARPPHIFFGTMIGAYLLLAFTMAVIVDAFSISHASAGATLGFFMWLGCCMAIGLTGWISSDKHAGVYAIDLAYQLVYMVMMGAIIGGWRS